MLICLGLTTSAARCATLLLEYMFESRHSTDASDFYIVLHTAGVLNRNEQTCLPYWRCPLQLAVKGGNLQQSASRWQEPCEGVERSFSQGQSDRLEPPHFAQMVSKADRCCCAGVLLTAPLGSWWGHGFSFLEGGFENQLFRGFAWSFQGRHVASAAC